MEIAHFVSMSDKYIKLVWSRWANTST